MRNMTSYFKIKLPTSDYDFTPDKKFIQNENMSV